MFDQCVGEETRVPFFLSSATQFWRKKVLQVANDHRDVTFAIADEQSFMEELKDFALDDSGEEVNVGCFDDKDKKYRMDPDEEFDEDSLRDFVENFKEGKNSSFLVANLFLKAPIDLFSLYVLFFHFKPRDALMGICLLLFFISRAHICTCLRQHLKETIPNKNKPKRSIQCVMIITLASY